MVSFCFLFVCLFVCDQISSETWSWDDVIDPYMIRGLCKNYLECLIYREERKMRRQPFGAHSNIGAPNFNNNNNNRNNNMNNNNMSNGNVMPQGPPIDAISLNTNDKVNTYALPTLQLKDISPRLLFKHKQQMQKNNANGNNSNANNSNINGNSNSTNNNKNNSRSINAINIDDDDDEEDEDEDEEEAANVVEMRCNIIGMIIGRSKYTISPDWRSDDDDLVDITSLRLNGGNNNVNNNCQVSYKQREFSWYLWDGTYSVFIDNEDWDDVWTLFDENENNSSVVKLPFDDARIVGSCVKMHVNLNDDYVCNKSDVSNKDELFCRLLTEIDCGYWVEMLNVVIKNEGGSIFGGDNSNESKNDGIISLTFDAESYIRILQPSRDSRIKKKFHHLMQSLSKYTHCVTDFTREHFKFQSYTLIGSILKQNNYLLEQMKNPKNGSKVCLFTNYKIRGIVIDYRPQSITQWAIQKKEIRDVGKNKNKNRNKNMRNKRNTNKNDNDVSDDETYEWCFELMIQDCNGVLPVAFVGDEAVECI